jgi:hypothetical protein
MPVVVMYSRRPCRARPLWCRRPQTARRLRAAAAIDCTTRSSVSTGRPSSRINPAVRNMGTAPDMLTSLTVPHTASRPISPPGKNSGVTMCESVETASAALQPGFHPAAQAGKVIPRAQRRAAQVGHKHALDQFLGHAPAAAVAHHDLLAVLQRHGAGRPFKVGKIVHG